MVFKENVVQNPLKRRLKTQQHSLWRYEMKKSSFRNHPDIVAALCLILLLVPSLARPAQGREDQKLYTAYNIWLLRGFNMKFINFKYGSEFIPAGTEVKGVKIVESSYDSMGGESSDPYVTFTRVDNNKNHRLYYENRYHPNKSIEDYKDKTFTPRNLSDLTQGFTENELTAISKGIVADGMSREAVLVSYGYPPEHRTSLQSDNTWTYWLSKRKQKSLKFDDNGYTIDTGNAGTGKRIRTYSSATASQTQSRDTGNIVERLKVLEDLKNQGLITPEEHEQKRKELLKQL